jgi:methoxymalonate biosynthesis protein
VVSFGAGSTILNWLIDQASLARVHLVADFRGTDRNRIMEIAYRFAGFSQQACGCQTRIAQPSDHHGVQWLHLEPVGRRESTVTKIVAPQLAEKCDHSERSAYG